MSCKWVKSCSAVQVGIILILPTKVVGLAYFIPISDKDTKRLISINILSFLRTSSSSLSICSTSSGPSFFRTNFPIEITARISPLWSHTAFPMIGAIFNLEKTLTDTSKNCSSLYLGRSKHFQLP